MLPVFISMCLFTLLGSISPGPVNLIAASRGASAGFFRAMPHVLGASVSYVCIVWLVGSGLNLVFLANPAIGQALQLVGAAYLLYLAAKIAMAPPATRQEGAREGASAGLMQGVWTQSLNPKAWMFASSGVSLFATADQAGIPVLLVFCGISGVVCFVSVAIWAALGTLIGQWLFTARNQRVFNRTMAVLLALTVLSMLAAI
ncbi:MAG: hypothetical protein A3F78_08290 [Burkholderiales bacterium RIFCSPLOWO2_12_FULL_61_40]|nr:MAG: hypothetical protein A3F78_08290 [Burkholderiales bacterium RIFCSPLOWO2_12_FULL_61_40]